MAELFLGKGMAAQQGEQRGVKRRFFRNKGAMFSFHLRVHAQAYRFRASNVYGEV